MKDKQLTLTVRAREQLLYSGPVNSITSFNDKGKFDVLELHANFISIIKNILIIREINGNTREIKLEGGIMRVVKDKVDVYLGVKQSPEKERKLKS